jgi:hypothetical protein
MYKLDAYLALSCIALLAGCGGGSVMSPSIFPTPQLAGNWQIQSGYSITASPTGPVFLVGAIQGQGTQVTGTFSTTSICAAPQVVNYSGSFDPSTGVISLVPTPSVTLVPPVGVELALPVDLTEFSIGNLQASGLLCSLVLSAPAIGVQIAPLTGTFAGPVASSGSNGNFSMTLTQSVTPNASGQFPLTGSVTFSNGVCVESTLAPMSGTVNGVGMTLSTQNISVVASTNPAATQLSATSIVFPPGSCANGTYAGTLVRQ